jgi:hypothetical protein
MAGAMTPTPGDARGQCYWSLMTSSRGLLYEPAGALSPLVALGRPPGR